MKYIILSLLFSSSLSAKMLEVPTEKIFETFLVGNFEKSKFPEYKFDSVPNFEAQFLFDDNWLNGPDPWRITKYDDFRKINIYFRLDEFPLHAKDYRVVFDPSPYKAIPEPSVIFLFLLGGILIFIFLRNYDI